MAAKTSNSKGYYYKLAISDIVPPTAYFIPTEKAWKRFLQRNPGLPQDMDYPLKTRNNPGICSEFVDNTGLSPNIITICLNEDYFRNKCKSPTEAIGYIVHEVIHAWQFILEAISEEKASYELEAYSLQTSVMDVINSMQEEGWDIYNTTNKEKETDNNG